MPEVKKSHKPALNKTDITTYARWLNTIRLIGGTACGATVAMLWALGGLTFDPRPILFILIPAYLLVSGGRWFLFKRREIPSSAILYIQLFIDLVVITIGVHLSGGPDSPFVFLYLIVVVSAAVLSIRATVFVGTCALLFFIGLNLVEGLGVVSGPDAGTFSAADEVRLGVLLLLIIVVAFQSNFLISRIRRKEKELGDLKDEFLFRTIHDLRAPSAVIRMIINQYDQPEWLTAHPETKEDVAFVKEANARMLNLIKDLFDIASGAQKEIVLRKEPVDLSGLVRGALAESKPALSKKEVGVAYEPPEDLPRVFADAEKTKEVFINLIDNAAKYNTQGGAITISHEVADGQVKTRVADTGMGIAEEYQKKLFTAYYRAGLGKEIPGTGLGLYIVKQLVEKMGGNVEVASKLHEGTTFTVSLPIAR